MTIVEFILLSAANLTFIFVIIRRRGIASAEGLCLAYLGVAAASDNLFLLFHYLVSPDVLPLGYREFAFRTYPTAIEILGLLVLLAALELADGEPQQIWRELDFHDLARLRSLGLAISAIGGTLAAIALYLVGAFTAPSFYGALNLFRSQALPFGGFWYRGADIAVFGLALTLPALQGKKNRLVLILALMMLASFFLRTNKGGLEEPLIWGALVLFVYNRNFFKALLNFKIIALAVVIAFVGVGAKFWILPNGGGRGSIQPSFAQFLYQAGAAASIRWSDDGLYRGYCQFINSWPENRALFRNSKVGVYSLLSWIPRFVYPDKSEHPFRGLGFMIYSDFHAFPDETPAPMLFGSAMADHGIAGVIAYLFVTGLLLGILRRFSASPARSMPIHCGYIFFVLFGGFSAEEGSLGILYTLVLAWGVIAAACLLLFAKGLLSPQIPTWSARVPPSPAVENIETANPSS